MKNWMATVASVLVAVGLSSAGNASAGNAAGSPVQSIGCQGLVNGEGVKAIVNLYAGKFPHGSGYQYKIMIGSASGTFNADFAYTPNPALGGHEVGTDRIVLKHSDPQFTIYLRFEELDQPSFLGQIIIVDSGAGPTGQTDYDIFAHLECSSQGSI